MNFRVETQMKVQNGTKPVAGFLSFSEKLLCYRLVPGAQVSPTRRASKAFAAREQQRLSLCPGCGGLQRNVFIL